MATNAPCKVAVAVFTKNALSLTKTATGLVRDQSLPSIINAIEDQRIESPLILKVPQQLGIIFVFLKKLLDYYSIQIETEPLLSALLDMCNAFIAYLNFMLRKTSDFNNDAIKFM